MRWHDVLWAISREAQAHPLLAEIYGAAIRMSGTQEHAVPSLEYFIVADSASELWEPCIIQWDQWTTSLEDLVLSEAALRSLFDHALPITMAVGGYRLIVPDGYLHLTTGAGYAAVLDDDGYLRLAGGTLAPALPTPERATDVTMWSQFTDGAELTSPERAGYYGRALRFRMTPLRDCLRGGRS